MIHRVYEFFIVKKCPLFFLELCYFVWVWSVVVIAMGANVRYIYPFIHGPLILFTLIDGEAYVFDSMNKVTSVMLHNFSSVVVCTMYVNSNDFAGMEKLSDNFLYYFTYSIAIFGTWYIPYSIHLFCYHGTGKTLLRHKFVSDKTKPTPLKLKIIYCICYLVAMIGAICFGIVSMHCIILTYTMISASLISIIFHTSWYYCTDGDRSKKFSIMKIIKSCSGSNESINQDILIVHHASAPMKC
jgi:hypothetical protein